MCQDGRWRSVVKWAECQDRGHGQLRRGFLSRSQIDLGLSAIAEFPGVGNAFLEPFVVRPAYRGRSGRLRDDLPVPTELAGNVRASLGVMPMPKYPRVKAVLPRALRTQGIAISIF